MKRILSLLLLYPFALTAGLTQSVILDPPSGVKIAATTTLKEQHNPDEPPEEHVSTTFLSLEKGFFSLREKTRMFVELVDTSIPYTTALALQNVTRNGINVECTTTYQHDSNKKQVWPLTIPLNENFNETKELDLLDDAGEKVRVTITSTITQ